MNLLPCAIESKSAVVIMYRAPRRKLVGQHPPRTTGAAQVKNAVNDPAYVNRAMSAARLRCGNQRFDDRPLPIRQVAGVRIPFHIPHIGSLEASHTLSERVEKGTVIHRCNDSCLATQFHWNRFAAFVRDWLGTPPCYNKLMVAVSRRAPSALLEPHVVLSAAPAGKQALLCPRTCAGSTVNSGVRGLHVGVGQIHLFR